MSEETTTGVIQLKGMLARGDLISAPSTCVVTGRSPGRRHPPDDGIMRVTDVCEWRGARANVRIRRCGRELLDHIIVTSPNGDQTLPPKSVIDEPALPCSAPT